MGVPERRGLVVSGRNSLAGGSLTAAADCERPDYPGRHRGDGVTPERPSTHLDLVSPLLQYLEKQLWIKEAEKDIGLWANTVCPL